jgi:ribosomal protein S18 acetylase RimI-like enzyme
MILIRKMLSTDIKTIYRMGRSCRSFDVSGSTSGFWSEEVLRRWCVSRNDILLVAEDSHRIVGFAFCSCHRPTLKAVLENIWVDRTYRRIGIGNELIKCVIHILLRRRYRVLVAHVSLDLGRDSKRFFEGVSFTQGRLMQWYDLPL